MEDNNAINEQLDNAVDYEKKYNNLVVEYQKLEDAANKLYNHVKQLENTWMLHRANFLFEVMKLDAFNGDAKIKAEEELINFLFPKKEEQTDKED